MRETVPENWLVPAVQRRNDLTTCARASFSIRLPENESKDEGRKTEGDCLGFIFYPFRDPLYARLRGHPACRIEFERLSIYAIGILTCPRN